MKLDITNQKLFTSLTTLLVVATLGTIATTQGEFTPLEMVGSPSLLGGFVDNFESRHRIWAIIISSVITLSSSISLGRVMTAFNIFDRACFIQLPVAGVIAWSVGQSDAYLTSALILYLAVNFIRSIFKGVRNDNRGSLEHLFNSAMLLSLLPTFYSPAIILWGVIPITLLVMGVTLREWIVMLVGLITPPLIILYLSWLCGNEFLYPAHLFLSLLQFDTNMLHPGVLPLFDGVIIGVLLICSVIGVVIVAISESVHRIKVRQRIVVVLFIAGLVTILAPSANVNTLTLLTPALAVLTSITLVRIRGLFATIVYSLLLLLFILSEFIPLYLSL